MPRLEIHLLGAPEITVDGKLIVVDTRKATALFAYLAVTGQRHTRDALAALLWPDYNQTDARAALRRTLSALNKALNGDWLAIDREALALIQSQDMWCDVKEFEQQLAQCRQHGHADSEVCLRCLPLLQAAAKCYQGDFMAGFTLRDSPNFDDWQFFQAENLRLTLASSLERLTRSQIAQADYSSALATARRWLVLDSLHEPAHRSLMQLYAWTGQHSAALRQYRECVRILEEELGVPPLAETTELYQAITEHREHPPQPADLGSPRTQVISAQSAIRAQAMPAQSTMVGRELEWRQLIQVYQAITTGRLIIIEGEGGIGKTRLADSFVAYARGQGAPLLAARCYAGEAMLAYSPISQCLRAALVQPENLNRLASIPSHWLMETARLLPELTGLLPTILHPNLPPVPSLENAGAQNRFLRA